MFNGTVVLGKIIKLLRGNTGIFIGSSSFFIAKKTYLIR